MKNLYKLFTLTVGILALSACESDRDSNPILNEPETFVLNVPAFAANNVYDLKNSKSLEISCTQPDYGIPMATTYSVQVSLEDQFVDATTREAGTAANYTTLGTTYTSANMQVSALEFALALGDLWSAKSDENFPTTPIPVYVRLKAEITNSGRGIAYSNIIELPKVLGYKAVPPLELPTTMFMFGSMTGSNWTKWVPMAAVNGMPKFFGLFYFNGNDMFKFGTKEAEYIGFNDPRLTVANSDAFTGIDDGFGGQNIGVNVTGWYTVIISASIKGTAYAFTLDIAPGEVYLIGNSIGSWGFGDSGKFQAPTTADADFISPACTGGGELRMSVKVPGEEWWRTEFAIPSGKIVFRENKNVINSWSEVGPEYAVTVSAGQKVKLNFVQKTGSVTQ